GVRRDVSVLVDGSKAGGAWRSEDEEPSPVAVAGRAQALDDFARNQPIFVRPVVVAPGRRIGHQARGAVLDVIQPREQLILRGGCGGPVTDDEIAACQDYVRCGGRVILLSDAKEAGDYGALA